MASAAIFLFYPAVYAIMYELNGERRTGELKLMIRIPEEGAHKFFEEAAEDKYGKDLRLVSYTFARPIK